MNHLREIIQPPLPIAWSDVANCKDILEQAFSNQKNQEDRYTDAAGLFVCRFMSAVQNTIEQLMTRPSSLAKSR
jgi:hypothetical protein